MTPETREVLCNLATRLEDLRDKDYYKGDYGSGRYNAFDRCIDEIEDLLS